MSKSRISYWKDHPGSAILRLLVWFSAILTVAVMAFLVGFILIKGVRNLSPELFALEYNSDNASLMPALINTLIITLLTLVIAVPFGIFAAIYLVEYAKKGSKLVKIIRITTETLQGIPSIIFGLFGLLFFSTAIHWGYFSSVRCHDFGYHDLATDHPYYRGSTSWCPGCIPGSLFWPWGRKASYSIQGGTSKRHSWNFIWCSACNRTYCR